MASYIITAPDGTKWQVTAPEGASEAEVLKYAQSQWKGGKEPTSVKAGRALADIPRQVGLTGRYALEGLGEVAEIGTEPIRALLGHAGITGGEPLGRGASRLADAIGLPSPRTADERAVGQAARFTAGAGGLTGVGRLAAHGTGPVSQAVGRAFTVDPTQQIVAAGAAGLASGAAKESGAGALGQAGAGVAGGLGGALALGGARGATQGVKQLMDALRPQNIDVRLERVLKSQGVEFKELARGTQDALRNQMRKALQADAELDPAAVRRLVDFAKVGATPTRGTVTLDPVQVTREQNLAKMAANQSDQGLQGLPRIQNENNRALIENLNRLGAGGTDDAFAAGRQAMAPIVQRDARAAATQRALYQQAQQAAGREIPLDRVGFVNDAWGRLAKTNRTAFLPEDVKTLLNRISLGDERFDVNTIDNLKTILAAKSRGTSDGTAKAAIKAVRDALEDVRPQMPSFGPGVATARTAQAMGQADDAAQEALKAFDRARRYSRARFQWQESSPAIQAALDGTPPEQFVNRFVIKAPIEDAATLARNVDPAAREAVRGQLMAYIKDKALSGRADEVGNVSQAALNKAINAIGDRKLKLFFSPQEIDQLKAVGRVASYMQHQPVGSAVNNSNSGAFMLGAGADMLSALSGKLPLGRALIGDPMAAWQASIGTNQARNLTPGLLNLANQPSAAERAIFPLTLGAGLLATQ
jgi:hypothetical protein